MAVKNWLEEIDSQITMHFPHSKITTCLWKSKDVAWLPPFSKTSIAVFPLSILYRDSDRREMEMEKKKELDEDVLLHIYTSHNFDLF